MSVCSAPFGVRYGSSCNVGNANNVRNVNPSGTLNNNNANNTNGAVPDCVYLPV